MDNTELICCPYCGADAISESDIPVEGLHTVCCENTACLVKPFVVGKTKQEATEKWNTRKPMQQIVSKLIDECENDNAIYRRGIHRAIEIIAQNQSSGVKIEKGTVHGN